MVMKTKTAPLSETRCDGIRRRDFLHAGFLAGVGLSLTDWFRLRARAAAATTPHSTSCIMIWLDGGPSHLDTFDLKPDAPREIRGEFDPIATSVDGIQICEHLPRTARIMQEVALVRSLTHELGNHDTGSHYLLTGHRPTPVVEYPSLGSIAARELPVAGAMPPYVAIPETVRAGRAGYLPQRFSPFSLGGDPSKPNYRVRDLDPPADVSLSRVVDRQEVQRQLDAFSREIEESGTTRDRDAFYEQAYRLIVSPQAKAAFDPSAEPARMRQRYGRSRIGTGCLLARRLIESGVRFVTVVDKGWDMHQQIFKAMPDALFRGSGKLPALDQAYSALITDLKERGLLSTTLVVLMGEFGRTPKINNAAGRDHWPRAGFVCFAGGGVRGGQVIGATDSSGETPIEQPVRPEDVAFTMLHSLGIDPEKEYQAPGGRPLKIQGDGGLIAGLT